ncbi:MAG: diaminopimelate epimerase [Flavobacteriales bacterium]|nr:diaminopimelate epimerase [Flavobacteriales bacterium]
MKICFHKYSGAGNDFIIVDDRLEVFPEYNAPLIQRMCDRHFGVGSDGMMLIKSHPTLDFEMVFFNPDASKSLCGNGSRCAVHLARELGLASTKGRFLTTDGVHQYQFMEEPLVQISMSEVNSLLDVKGHKFLDTGSPHLIICVDELENYDVLGEGRKWRYHKEFEARSGANVNFIKKLSETEIEIRTFERGVEGETLSCGTGVTAAALATAVSGYQKKTVHTRGGTLYVEFIATEEGYQNIWLTGPVLKTFEGVFYA